MSFPTNANATNNFGVAQFIVDPIAGKGTHTTIANALTSAVSGQTIFIRPGTYTENITLKAGVNLSAFDCDALTPNVTIVGKASFSSAGAVSISGIQLKTNSDFALAITGSVASIVNLQNCFINCNNNTGLSFTSSSASARLNIYDCQFDTGTTGIAYFADSSAGTTTFLACRLSNTGLSSTTNTKSAGILGFFNSVCQLGLTYSSSSNASAIINSDIDTAAINITPITTSGTGGMTISHCYIAAGTASALSIGAGTDVTISQCTISSTNTNVLTGAGSIKYGLLSFTGSSTGINTTSQLIYTSAPMITSALGIGASPGTSTGLTFDGTNFMSNYATATWTPNLQIAGSSTGITYTTQAGGYTRIGNVVTIWAQILLSSKGASVGNVTISNLPVATSTNGANQCMSISFFNGFSAAGTFTTLGLWTAASSAVATFVSSGNGVAVAQITNANLTNTFQVIFSGSYIID